MRYLALPNKSFAVLLRDGTDKSIGDRRRDMKTYQLCSDRHSVVSHNDRQDMCLQTDKQTGSLEFQGIEDKVHT
jgi:hypothetical protein